MDLGEEVNYKLPTDFFVDVNVSDPNVTVIALEQGKDELPSWLSFNSTTLSFEGTPPNKTPNTYVIVVITVGETHDKENNKLVNVARIGGPVLGGVLTLIGIFLKFRSKKREKLRKKVEELLLTGNEGSLEEAKKRCRATCCSSFFGLRTTKGPCCCKNDLKKIQIEVREEERKAMCMFIRGDISMIYEKTGVPVRRIKKTIERIKNDNDEKCIEDYADYIESHRLEIIEKEHNERDFLTYLAKYFKEYEQEKKISSIQRNTKQPTLSKIDIGELGQDPPINNRMFSNNIENKIDEDIEEGDLDEEHVHLEKNEEKQVEMNIKMNATTQAAKEEENNEEEVLLTTNDQQEQPEAPKEEGD
ncbi:MAG: putative Ig domain-containing protein [Bacteroidota bacterium]